MHNESPTTAMYQTPGAIFGRVVLYSILIIAAIYFLIPLLVMIITSLKTMNDIRTGHLISCLLMVGLGAYVYAGAPLIPAVSEWGMIALGLTVLIAGTLLIHRRTRLLNTALACVVGSPGQQARPPGHS